MITELAEELYEKSFKLKKYSPQDLIRKSKRSELLSELSDIQLSVKKLLEELKNDTNYSPEHYELALSMESCLFRSVVLLASKGNRQTVWNFIHGFHNLPRAFLSCEHSMYSSPEDALAYYRSYMKTE